MKKVLPLILLISLVFNFCTQRNKPHQIKVITFNIRFDNPNDAPNDWPSRIPVVEKYLKTELPDIMGVQEALYHQNEDILKMIPGYAYVGTGRDDGAKGGEFSTLFFNTSSFKLLEQGQFWLSETPDAPGSIGWEAILPRVVAWAKLKHLASGIELYAFNTHYCHISDLARRRSMEFMSAKINEIAGDYPIIVTGDFNITKGPGLYEEMIVHLKSNNGLQNAELLSEGAVSGSLSTFNAFRDDTEPRIIDYIFVTDRFTAESYSVDIVKQGNIFISDHWPVKAIFTIK